MLFILDMSEVKHVSLDQLKGELTNYSTSVKKRTFGDV